MTDKKEQNIDTKNQQDNPDEIGSDQDNIITLDMEDGSQKDFLVLDVIERKGKQYIALAELDSNEYDILSMTITDDTVELNVIEDDDEFDAVAAEFEEHFSQMEEEAKQ
ncbi:MAG: DUF1292 domain-containing protein [Candidatus Syntrophosphaera sp.]